MSTIRRQSIISSLIIYIGFAIGALNTYLFTRKGGFTEAEYGLTGMFIAVASFMYAVANLGMPAFINKFFPYYQAHLPKEKNDQLTWALLIPTIGFLFVIVMGMAFKNTLVDKIFNNSPELLEYYYWIFPFGYGFTIFLVMESYAQQNREPVLSNFLREVLFRLCTTILIALTAFGLISSFDLFIKSYSFIYILLAVIFIVYFAWKGKFHLVFKMSKLTNRFFDKIVTLCSFVWMGTLVFTISGVFDTIVIAAVMPNGLAYAGIFTLAQYMSSMIQAPQRGIIASAIGPLSQAWREKDYQRINRIYHRSSINQLIFSCAMYCLILLNFRDGVLTFNLKEAFLQAQPVFFYMGLMRVIDMGTGVNAQIIGTSTFWRFEFITGLILAGIALPLNYVLTREMGIIGPAISNLVAFTVYNLIRYLFLWKKFQMQPFTAQSGYTILLAAGAFLLTYLLFHNYQGFLWIMLRSAFFALLFGGGTILLKLTPDLQPIVENVKKRLGF